MKVDFQRVLEGNIMSDVGDGVNLKRAARERLDNLSTATTSHNENSYQLYHCCTDIIKEIQSEITALQIALIVWRVVTKIEVDQQLSVVNDDDSVESDNECDYAKCLFDALDSVIWDAKRRDVNFVMDLVGRVDNFIEDDDITEAEQRRMEQLKCVKNCV